MQFEYSSSFGFSFLSVAHVWQPFTQVCVAFNVFLFFAFSLSCSTMFWFDKANRLSAIFFHFGVQIWRFPGVSIATSVLHSITWTNDTPTHVLKVERNVLFFRVNLNSNLFIRAAYRFFFLLAVTFKNIFMIRV